MSDADHRGDGAGELIVSRADDHRATVDVQEIGIGQRSVDVDDGRLRGHQLNVVVTVVQRRGPARGGDPVGSVTACRIGSATFSGGSSCRYTCR